MLDAKIHIVPEIRDRPDHHRDCLWFSGVREIYGVIVRSSFGVIAGAFALSILSVGLIAVKWRFVLPAIGVAELFRAALIGQFYSFFLLGQASGEAAKIYLISRDPATSVARPFRSLPIG